MKLGKNLALMGLGAGALMAYQKYSKPAITNAKKQLDKAVQITNQKLEKMM